MKVYSVLKNTYDYYRFTDYLGTYPSMKKARQKVLGLRTIVVNEGEDYFSSEWEEEYICHAIIVVKRL